MIAFLSGFGWHELLIVLGVAMLIFGAKRLPGLGRGIGQGVAEFGKAIGQIRGGARAAAESPAPPKVPR